MVEGRAVLSAVLIVIIAVPSAYFIWPYIFSATPTGFSFGACDVHSDNSQTCSQALTAMFDTVPSQVTAITFSNPSASFTYQGSISLWSFACSGTITFAAGNSQPISATASGTGSPPSSFPVSINPSGFSLSQIYGSNYGQKNITAQFGSKVSPCTLTVAFSNSPITMTKAYRFSKIANWVVNYQAVAPSITTTTVTSTQTTTVTSSTTTSGSTVSTSQTDIWTTTITSASGGATGNAASNGIIATLAPDYYFQQSQSVVWVYLPSSIYSQCSVGIFVTIVTPSQSVTVGRLASSNAWIGGISFQVAVTPNNLYLLQVLCGNSTPTTLFNQVLTAASPYYTAANGGNLPQPPYDAQYLQSIQPVSTTTTTATALCTGYKADGTTPIYGYTWKTCNVVMSIVSIGF